MLSSKRIARALLLAALPALGQAAPFVDVLDLPAQHSELAVRSPLLAVTHAGARLVSVGQRGHILYSDTAGQTWQQAEVPVSADLNAVHFPTPAQGWAVGNDGVILHSVDGGRSWQKQLDGRRIGALMVEHYAALAAAEPEQPRWAELLAEGQRFVDEGADKPLLGVWFADERTGYAVGVFNLILRTSDGGRHWQPLLDRVDNPQGFHLNAIASTGDGLYIVGEQGLVLKWDAGRERFTSLPSPYQGTFFGVIGRPGEVLVHGLRGHVFRSRDGGRNWQALDSGLQVSITAATLDAQGHYRLFTQAGHLLRDDGNALQLLTQAQQAPVAGAVAVDDGLVLVGGHGVRRLTTQ
ncbi:WD40/YVTN/BNR-like repeat-containing protein [Zestomonas carbonaria]|uniref:Ycf48-like protein n=1 Tax=Zestomonas carbonaria TaxID=2762745 RepID=A0A7U7ELW1_9GAMM|nr:YCF48-related protein [Pseudomonas carbonaria]CAD5107433.1 Ycf48-like protein [Pseudomonas carbonaria]